MIWSFELLQQEVGKITNGPAREREKIQKLTELLYDVIARSIPVDEKFYLETYPDIADAIVRGELVGAAEHFVEHGFYENRLPCPAKVDEEKYAETYPDIRDAITEEIIPSATYHWINYGRFEGREVQLVLPSED